MGKSRGFLATAVLFVACITNPLPALYTPYGNSVHLASTESLTFFKGKDTTYRRSSPIPQLLCRKGCDYEPVEVQCKNLEAKGRDVLWQCEADLPSHLIFAETEVNCEGYSSKEDDHVLEGSCGLKYSLARTGSQQSWGFLQLLIIAALLFMPYFYILWSQRGL